MRRPRDPVAAPSTKVPAITRHALSDRPLFRIDPGSAVWSEPRCRYVDEGAIVWVKPPPGVDRLLLARVLLQLKQEGAHVKLLAADVVDDVVVENRSAVVVPELAADQTREVVYQLCRELSTQAGIPTEQVIAQVEPYLASAGL